MGIKNGSIDIHTENIYKTLRYFTLRGVYLYSIIFFILYMINPVPTSANSVITNVNISICGDGIVSSGEVCDDGVGNNTGAYASSTAERHCNADCLSYGSYCGDDILQVRFTEECDDGNNVSGDFCSSACLEEDAVTQGGGGGAPTRGNIPGGGGFTGSISSTAQTKVVIRGKAYPSADINILLDGEVIGVVKADTNADFLFSTTKITPGTATFGFWAQDRSGIKSISTTAIFEVVQSAITTVAGIFLPPTIDLSNVQISPGEFLTISGQSVPNVSVLTEINSPETIILEAETSLGGDWAIQLDTSSLEKEAFHTAKAYFELEKANEGLVQSGFGRAVSFYIGEKKLEEVVSVDINNDGRINLVDFSIFLVNWGTSDIRTDFNQDGVVNLADFSIMLFYWTG